MEKIFGSTQKYVEAAEMIVKTVDEISGSERDVRGTANGQPWRSQRLLLKRDGMNFSLHVTTIPNGSEHRYWYKDRGDLHTNLEEFTKNPRMEKSSKSSVVIMCIG